MEDVGRPSVITSPLSGRTAPVMRLMKVSAAGRSRPINVERVPDGIRRSRTRSGRNAPYCFSTSCSSSAVAASGIQQLIDFGHDLAAFGERVDFYAQREQT